MLIHKVGPCKSSTDYLNHKKANYEINLFEANFKVVSGRIMYKLSNVVSFQFPRYFFIVT